MSVRFFINVILFSMLTSSVVFADSLAIRLKNVKSDTIIYKKYGAVCISSDNDTIPCKRIQQHFRTIDSTDTTVTVVLSRKAMKKVTKGSAINGSRSRKSIIDGIQKSIPEIRKVYLKYQKNEPNLSGKVIVKFTIDSAGAVIEASIHSSTLGNQNLEKDVDEVVKSIQFDKVKKGKGVTTIKYPFVFAL